MRTRMTADHRPDWACAPSRSKWGKGMLLLFTRSHVCFVEKFAAKSEMHPSTTSTVQHSVYCITVDLIYLIVCETSCLHQTAICPVGAAKPHAIGRLVVKRGEGWGGSPLYLGRERSCNTSCPTNSMRGDGVPPVAAIIHKGCSWSDTAESNLPPPVGLQFILDPSRRHPSPTIAAFIVKD